MFKKWWFYVIIAVVVILIAVPLTTIIRLNNSVYDLGFNYVQIEPENLLPEIAKKNVYYEAETQTLEIELNQDLINSILKDQLATLPLGLPANFSIQEAAFKTADQRLYVNAKYGAISLPLSAKLNIAYDDTGISVSVDSFNLGDKKAPGLVTNQIPSDQLTFAIKYADLGLPQIFTVKDIKFSTGNVNAFVQLDVAAIQTMAKDYRNEVEKAILTMKSTASPTVATFIDRALEEGLLSDANVDKYVTQVLGNEELVNSAVLFALAPDLDKYAKGIETYQKAIMDWAAPIQTVKLDGTIEDTVDSIIYNNELQDMLAWFIPAATLTEYVDTADTIYTTYKEAQGSLNTLSMALEKGDYEKAIRILVADKDLYNMVTLVVDSKSADYYIGAISQYYNMYADLMVAFHNALDSIPDDKITEYVNAAYDFAYQIDDGQQFLKDLIAGVDTKSVQAIVSYLDQDQGVIKEQLNMIHPDYYTAFKFYVDNLDFFKGHLTTLVENAEIESVKEGAQILNNINKDLIYVLDLLKAEKFEKAGEAIGKIRFDQADKFIKETTAKINSQV